MKNKLLHTPEGVRDIYDDECERKIILEDKFFTMLRSYGYHPIQTPTYEFFDIFAKEIGSTPSKDLYKFIDREGNTLVLRPDITPSIARCAAKYFLEEEVSIRFCYTGNTFINNNSYQGRLKERTQAGAELIGDASVDADAEMITLTVKLLIAAGLKEFQISVGHTEYLNGLFEAAGMDEETEEEVKNLLLNRNFSGVQEVIAKLNLNSELVYLFAMLQDVMITREKMAEAKEKAAPYEKIYRSLERLEELDDILELYKVRNYVSYELAMLSNLEYYTGVIFAGYTFGSGEAVVNGGRYDHLLTHFGKDAPSIGFAIIIDQLLDALSRQDIKIPFEKKTKWFIYDSKYRTDAIKDAIALRARGENVELMKITETRSKEIFEAYARQNNIQDIIYYM